MSLSVYARRIGIEYDEGASAFEMPASPHNHLAGFESWRTTVWGSSAAKRLGLRVLPTLATGDVCASGEQLEQLEADVKLLQHRLRAFVDELLAQGVHIVASPSDPYETVQFRLANIAEAVRLARLVSDGVGEVTIG